MPRAPAAAPALRCALPGVLALIVAGGCAGAAPRPAEPAPARFTLQPPPAEPEDAALVEPLLQEGMPAVSLRLVDQRCGHRRLAELMSATTLAQLLATADLSEDELLAGWRAWATG